MKKAFIIGINGKMGKNLCECAEEYGYTVSGGFDIKDGVTDGITVFGNAAAVNVDYDVVIDFSRPERNTLDAIVALAKSRNVPAVIATTGFDAKGLDEIKKLSECVPVFFSPNMSLGVAAAKAATKTVQSILGDGFDIEIVEKHHNQKADSPSGTALLFADALADKKDQVIGREGKRNKGELGIVSVRGGGVVGEHEIGFYGESETVTITHTAFSRKLFAAGAYKAADYVLSVGSPALYNMDDLVASLVK